MPRVSSLGENKLPDKDLELDWTPSARPCSKAGLFSVKMFAHIFRNLYSYGVPKFGELTGGTRGPLGTQPYGPARFVSQFVWHLIGAGKTCGSKLAFKPRPNWRSKLSEIG